MEDLAARVNAGDVAEPALQHLDVDAEREHVQSADLDPLPPMRGRVGIQICAGETLEPDVMRPAEIIFREQLFHQQIAAQAERRRAKHRDQLRETLRRREHLLGFGEIHRHPRLTKDMFARLERRNRHRRMHVRRRADPDDVEIGQREQIGPVLHRRRVRHVLVAELQRAFVSGVGDGNDLDFRVFLECRQMPGADDLSGADDADAKLVVMLSEPW